MRQAMTSLVATQGPGGRRLGAQGECAGHAGCDSGHAAADPQRRQESGVLSMPAVQPISSRMVKTVTTS